MRTLLVVIVGLVAAGAARADFLEKAKLTASDGAPAAWFGQSVAVSGEKAVVGARGDGENGTRAGAAYVFRWDGSNWVEEAKLTASDGDSDDQLGISVSVSGDTAVLGAWSDEEHGTNSGSAYVFRYDGSDWVEQAKLTASDGASGDYFGFSVAVSGDTAAIGAYRDSDNGMRSGSAYVFRYDGSDWVEQAKLTASDAAAGDEFGCSIAVSDETVVIGAHHDEDHGWYSGSAYVFRCDGSNWVEEAKLTASDGASGDSFGGSVALTGGTAVVGADNDDGVTPYSGSAYVFRYDGSNWVEEAKLTASDSPVDAEWFGQSVAVSGDTAVVGAPDLFDPPDGCGAAYVFRYDGTNWAEEAKLTASDGAPADSFGASVAVSVDTVVIGASLDDDSGSSSGSAYVFAAIPGPEPIPTLSQWGLIALGVLLLTTTRWARRRRLAA